MYLEISARRTGKTRRLVQAAKDNNSFSIIIVPNVSMVCAIKDWIDFNKYRHILIYSTISGVHSWKVRNKGIPYRLFYDEFELCKEVIINNNAYYATTPNRIRTIYDTMAHRCGDKNDTLLELLDMNSGMYVKYPWSNGVDILSSMNTQQIKTEINAEYVDYNKLGNCL